MQNIIYNLTKDILEETPFVSFEADDKAMTFTCKLFDRPIVLNITDKHIEPDSFQINHQILIYADMCLQSIYKGYTPKEKDVASCELRKHKAITKYIKNLRLILNVIKHNFLTDAIHSYIHGDQCKFFKDESSETSDYTCTFVDNNLIVICNGEIERCSKQKYDPDCFNEVNIFEFIDENIDNDEIFE